MSNINIDSPVSHQFHNETLQEHKIFLNLLLAEERNQAKLRELYAKTPKKSKKKRQNIKKKIKPRKKGAQRKGFDYDTAKAIVRDEAIMSAGQYAQWYQINNPKRMPKHPERAYKSTWTGWGDFLGVYNTYTRRAGTTSNGRGKYRTFADAKAFVRSLNLKSITEWREYTRSGKCPLDIPHRPEIVYSSGKRVDYWLSWKDFLGYEIKNTQEKIAEVYPVLYIAKKLGSPNTNVYVLNVIPGGKAALIDHLAKMQMTLIKAFYINITFNSGEFLRSLSPYLRGNIDEYLIPNVYDVIEYLEDRLDRVE